MQHQARTEIRLNYSPPEVRRTEPSLAFRRVARKRYFILTHGRSGSSLLSAILSSCGAQFGASCLNDQDTERDHWENRRIDRAIRCAHTANRFFSPAMAGLGKMAYRYWRSRSKTMLGAGLDDAVFSKNRWSSVVLPLAEQLDYDPVVIVSYRHPAEVALSDMGQLKNVPSTFMESITRTYLDALYALERYGGTVIDYSELMDPDCDDWAFALEAITGFDAGELVKARKRLLKPRRFARDASAVWLPSDLRAVSQNLLSMRNIPVPTTRRFRNVLGGAGAER